MKNKKAIIGVGILLILFLVLLLWPKSQKREEAGKKSFETAKINEYPNREIKIPDYLTKPEELNWQIQGGELPTSAIIYKTENETINEETAKKFVELMGLNYSNKKEMEGGTVWLFGSNDGRYEANIDLKTDKFRYGENIFSKAAVKSTKTIKTEEVEQKLTKLVEQLTGTVAKIKVDEIDYQEIVSPRWVSTSEGRAQAVQITASYIINDRLVRDYEGSPIKALYARDGRLLKLELSGAPQKWSGIEEKEVVDLATLKRVEAGLFRVWKITGNKDYQLKTETELVKKANLTKIEMEYIYDRRQLKLWPYYFIEGNSLTDNGLVKLTVIFPASKSD